MISNEIDEKKTKYFVIAIILLIILSIVLVVHFNNKSLVSGSVDEEIPTTTTTIPVIPITTEKIKSNKVNKKEETKKEDVEVLNNETVVYKSTIDETNKIIYNYKLTDEINNEDTIISKLLSINDELKNNNIIGLYDISLYDVNMNKKIVNNSLIDISIPLTHNLLGYDEYKIVYIDDNNAISIEEFKSVVENGYIKFTTSHLSKFGIIGIKKEQPKEEIVDLTNVTIDVKINDNITTEHNIYVSTKDKIDIVVNNLNKDYKLYYILKDDETLNTYQEFNNNIFENIDTPSKYILSIKIVVDNEEKVFEIGTVNIYDIVVTYDKNAEVKENIVYGEIKDENGVESNYIEPTENNDIVINNIELPEETESQENEENTSEQENIETTNDMNNDENTEIIPVETTTEETTNDGEELEGKATISLKGNIYLVEKTDISNLEITGYLIIDTSEDITFKTDNNELLTSKIYCITIKSKEFSINGIKYTYEYIENNLIIKRIDENSNEIDANEEINNLFKDFDIIKNDEDLILANPYN